MYRLQHGFPHYALCCATPHTTLSAVTPHTTVSAVSLPTLRSLLCHSPHYALCCVTPHTALSAVSLPTPGEHLSGIFFNAIPKSGHWKCFTSHPTSVSAPVTLDSQSVFSQAPLSDLRSDASRAKGRYRPLSDATCSCCSVSTVVQTHSVQLYRHTAYSCTDTQCVPCY